MDPETKKDAQETISMLSANGIKLQEIKNEVEALLIRVRSINAEAEANAPAPIPQGFIEITKRGTSNPVEKVMVAVHSITLIENFDWVENEPFSKLSILLSKYAGVAFELDVLESYDDLKRLIAAAY